MSTFLWYLASPYSKFTHGHEAAYREVSRIHARLLSSGLDVFCPIGHGHGLTVYGALDPVDAELWGRIDLPFVQRCNGLIVARMPGWDRSAGVAHEIRQFAQSGRPIVYTDPVP